MKKTSILSVLVLISLGAFAQPHKQAEAPKIMTVEAILKSDTIPLWIKRYDSEGYLQRVKGYGIATYQADKATGKRVAIGNYSEAYFDDKGQAIKAEDIEQIVPLKK